MLYFQEYLERARKRREMLAQKLADTSPRRKRTVPLLESQQINISPPKAVDDGRHCNWLEYNHLLK